MPMLLQLKVQNAIPLLLIYVFHICKLFRLNLTETKYSIFGINLPSNSHFSRFSLGSLPPTSLFSVFVSSFDPFLAESSSHSSCAALLNVPKPRCSAFPNHPRLNSSLATNNHTHLSHPASQPRPDLPAAWGFGGALYRLPSGTAQLYERRDSTARQYEAQRGGMSAAGGDAVSASSFSFSATRPGSTSAASSTMPPSPLSPSMPTPTLSGGNGGGPERGVYAPTAARLARVEAASARSAPATLPLQAAPPPVAPLARQPGAALGAGGAGAHALSAGGDEGVPRPVVDIGAAVEMVMVLRAQCRPLSKAIQWYVARVAGQETGGSNCP